MRADGNPIRHHFSTDTEPRRRNARWRRRGEAVEVRPRGLAHEIFLAAILAACLLVPLHVRAGQLNGEVSLASQLVDRGLAITPATPALQGAVAWTTPSGWSVGLSGGIELRSPGHLAAGVARVGHAWSLSPNWRMQADMVYYHYTGRLHANVYEPGVYWLYRDILTFGVSGVYIAGADGHKLHPAADLNFHWPLVGGFSLSGGLGIARYVVPYGREAYDRYRTGYYRYGQAGLLWSHGAWQVELDRVAVDSARRRYLRGLAASPWLATISRSF
ncbi:MAG TPA: hypothetical protein VJ862_13755 [Rhodanobacteraceae bacterium]|nr:hypothetical protein [Rhodanobacteraceae bacterium]